MDELFGGQSHAERTAMMADSKLQADVEIMEDRGSLRDRKRSTEV